MGDATTELCRDEAHRQRIVQLLGLADLGVAGVSVIDREFDEKWKTVPNSQHPGNSYQRSLSRRTK